MVLLHKFLFFLKVIFQNLFFHVAEQVSIRKNISTRPGALPHGALGAPVCAFRGSPQDFLNHWSAFYQMLF